MCAVTAIGLNSSPLAAAIWYVDGTVTECDNDGDSWADAFKFLQDALNNPFLVADDQIWVAAGTYYADQSCADEDGSGDRTATFQLKKDVFLLGGFEGTELEAEDRDPAEYETILSGALAQGQELEACALDLERSCFEEHSETG